MEDKEKGTSIRHTDKSESVPHGDCGGLGDEEVK